MLARMISDWTTSAPLLSGFFSRLERMTSTRSFGRMKPPAPVSGEISVEIARMPVGRIAAMKPEPLALTSFCSRIGSPAMKGERAIEPAISLMASALLARLTRLPAAEAGQACHCRSSGLTDWPSPMSDFATRISTVGNCTTGSAAGLDFSSVPRAR